MSADQTVQPNSVPQAPFIVSEYVALPGDRVGFVATDPKTGICCPGRDDRSLAKQDAEALNAAYASGVAVATAGHTCMVQACLALADGLEGAALLASERAARLRRSVELFRAAKVEKSAIPTGRNPAACENELATAIGAAEAPDGGYLCTRCGAPIDHGDPHLECDTCRAGVPTTNHAACENEGSLQHTPTTWIGNEQVNRPVGGGA